MFADVAVGTDLEVFQIIPFADLDIVKLYAEYIGDLAKSNIVVLPDNFIHPLFKPIAVSKGSKIKLSTFIEDLSNAGYERVDQVYDEMQFSQKGDVLTIYSNLGDLVYRIDFFDDDIEKITVLDNVSLRPKQNVNNAVLLNINPEEVGFIPEVVGNYDTFNPKIFIQSTKNLSLEAISKKESATEISFKYIPLFHRNEKLFNDFISKYEGFDLYYSGHHWDLLPPGIQAPGMKELNTFDVPFDLEKGFIVPEKKLILLTDKELLSTLNLTKAKSKQASKFKKLFDNEVNIGDYVVHEAHGVGIYRGIETKIVLGEVNDYVIVEYRDEDKLLIPLNQLERISKFISSDGHLPNITKLGTAEWDSIKRKLKKSVEDIAGELLEIYAKKNMEKGIEFQEDTPDQFQFESEFKYKLTDDQLKTLNEVKNDMESSKPMDRLIIGDVGFGKTEIALRAAFKAIQSGKQVLVLAPTTVLVTQLYTVFYSRLDKHGIKVARVSRFDGSKHNKEIIQRANDGSFDVLIGTHRLLSKDVQMPNVGLLIIDEEQRFGVKQKEKIRKIRANIDVLSMSATPIPRTLQMALTGIKDISIIATPPEGRLPVHNEVIFKEEIAQKIKDEIKRNGQVFIVHNKIEDIHTFVQEIKEQLPPSIKIAHGHGQMSGDKLEKIMFEFQERKFDVLIATTIIENGLDIPTVNTIIIDDAHNFGLSQLYQLRGRVGRSSVQGFCFLVLPKTREFIELHKHLTPELQKLHRLLKEHKIEESWIPPEAIARVEAILENQELGAGFKIASRDLEIRGSGNLLGSEQSGQINAVGYEMYVRLLEQEIERIRIIQKTKVQQSSEENL